MPCPTILKSSKIIHAVSLIAVLFLVASITPLLANTSTGIGYTVVNSSGASLPITYNLSSLTGTTVYASPNGVNSGNCNISSPCTLTRAVSQVPANGNVILRGGVYKDQRNITLSRSGITIAAYPGEVPELSGSVAVSRNSGWSNEGNLRYRSYVGRPVADASGVHFLTQLNQGRYSNCTNLTRDCVGRFADQVWTGQTVLRQVNDKSQVQNGTFFVDRTNNRLYMTTTDSSRNDIEISRPSTGQSDRDRLFYINGTNITVRGLKITRYSANAADFGVILVEGGARNTTIDNVELSHAPYTGIMFANPNKDSTLKNSTISHAGWMSVSADRTHNFTMDSVHIYNGDYFDEFTSSPSSGALKTGRTHNTVVKNSLIENNKSHGLWFDQSNLNVTVANNVIKDNQDSGVFFEISDGLLLINNYIKGTGSSTNLRLIGSSGLKIINNTSVGGAYPLGIYTDDRSKPGCSLKLQSGCGQQIGSDLLSPDLIPPTLDWMPRIDYMVNNIFAYPSGATNLCSNTVSVVCFMTSHASGANAPIQTIIHKGDPSRGIPPTYINGNVYANNSGQLVRVTNPGQNYSGLSAFRNAMASSPVNISSIDANSRHDSTLVNSDGSPTSKLSNLHDQAVSIPQDSEINKYIDARTKYYGTSIGVDVTVTTTTNPPVTTAKPPVTTAKPPVTTAKPPVTTAKPPVTTAKPPVTIPPKPVEPGVSNPEIVALAKMVKDHDLAKARQLKWDDPNLAARLYFKKAGFLHIGADVNTTVDKDGNYQINTVSWIISFFPIS